MGLKVRSFRDCLRINILLNLRQTDPNHIHDRINSEMAFVSWLSTEKMGRAVREGGYPWRRSSPHATFHVAG